MKIFEGVSGRLRRVWQRNFDVYRATWKVNFIPPLLEPLLYLFAFGLGLGGFVKSVPYQGLDVTYLRFIAPGLIATAVMNHGFFETTYSSYVRMYFQKTYDAILATPLSLEDVVLGEVAWGMTKAFFAGSIMTGVAVLFGLVSWTTALALVPMLVVGGGVFAGLGMCFTGLVRNIEMFNFPVFLFVTPMFLFSGVFFPLGSLPAWAQKVAWCLPLTPLVSLIRNAALGVSGPEAIWSWVGLSLSCVATIILSLVFMRRRLVR